MATKKMEISRHHLTCVVNELDQYHLAKDAALKIKGSQAEDFAKKWIRNYKNIKTIFVKMVLICQKYWIEMEKS